jgi:GDPmannose 4,6-dehydratase
VQTVPQNEITPFYPRSPYGVAKLYAHWIVKNYRESYNMFACSGLLFNHESERRGETFVTRKITRGISSIISGDLKFISLGNIDSKRDWGYAPDYVKGMWLMLQQDSPDDYVLATNEYHTVREFIEKSFNYVGINIKWQGSGINEVGLNESTGDILIKINEKYFRPAEVEELLGDYSKAYKKLGWLPETKFEKLVKIMMDYDLSIEKNKKNYYNKEGRFSFGEPCPPLPKQIFFKRENNDEHTPA